MNAPRWDLDSLFPGGVAGAPFQDAMAASETEARALLARARALPAPPEGHDGRVALWGELARWLASFGALRVCAGGQASADTTDAAARRAYARAGAVANLVQQAMVPIQDHVVHASDEAFAAMCADPAAEPFLPTLRTLRGQRHLFLDRTEEALLTELSVDGVHAWGRHYDRIAGRLQVALPDGARVSLGRAKHGFSSPDRAERAALLDAVDAAWASVEDDCAAVLTHLVGTRQTLNRRRGLDPVDDSLARNRMRRETLDAMIQAAAEAGPLLQRFLAVKARLLGVERLGWSDLMAPLGTDGTMSWDQATGFVVRHFGAYHPDLASLARRALAERWIEAEDRDNKRQGGYCAALPDGTSRIFMTFGGSATSMTTLAHELGHAFHNWSLRDAHPARRTVPSTLAETASVLAENLVRDAALAAATTDAERLALLDARLTAGVAFLMNLPFRYALEREMYVLRERGELDPAALNEASVRLQRAYHGDAMSSWFPRYWADKLHFYISQFAFYNYPYTFGYLFSSLIYQRSRAEGPSFHGRVVDVLQRSGFEHAEPLARDALGIDLTDPGTWVAGWAPLRDDLEAFEALAAP